MFIYIVILLTNISGQANEAEFKNDKVLISVNVESSIYTYRITNLSTDAIVRFKISQYAGHGFTAPQSWETKRTPKDFETWTEDIKKGIQRRSRNVVLTSFANDILPYRGIGSGILKSLQLYPHIHFENNSTGEFFKVTIERFQEPQ